MVPQGGTQQGAPGQAQGQGTGRPHGLGGLRGPELLQHATPAGEEAGPEAEGTGQEEETRCRKGFLVCFWDTVAVDVRGNVERGG